MTTALFALAALGAALDVFTTCLALSRGARERNPLLRALFARAAPLPVLMATHGGLVYAMWTCRPLSAWSLGLIALAWWGAAAWNVRGLLRHR